MSVEMGAVRVAAVAVALVEDRQRVGGPPAGRQGEDRSRRKWWEPTEMVLGLIRDERMRREEERGRRQHTSLEWLMILAGEVGELAAAVASSDQGQFDPRAREVGRVLQSAGREARQWIAGRDRPQQVVDREEG